MDWINILPGARAAAPFAARKRSVPRSEPAPMVPHVSVSYRQWDGPIGPWAEHFGKGKQQVHSLDASEPLRSCNEVEIAKLFRRSGRCAYWVSCYNPSQLPAIWQPFALAPSAMPAWLHHIDYEIRRLIPHKKGGIPDVVAWSRDEPAKSVVFVECKGPSEDFKESQEDWVQAAIAGGISANRFAVAIRHFV